MTNDQQRIMNLERAVCEIQQRLSKILEACSKFFELPNWENRVGPWKAENEALHNLAAVVKKIKEMD